jgi:RNA polymerase sigma-70 factor, ECF subfamily
MAGAGFSASDAERWIPRLRRYAQALTGQREAADDLIQDTLERAWRKRALWQPGTDLRAWLFTVMHNVHVNSVRAARPTESLDEDGAAAAVAAVLVSSQSAESGVVLSELRAALMQLSEEQRHVVLLVGLEQMSYAEAAGVLGVPIGTVMSRLARGREQLRVLLAQGARVAGSAAALRRVK